MCEYESKELLEYMNITYNCLYTQVLLEYNIESIIYYTVLGVRQFFHAVLVLVDTFFAILLTLYNELIRRWL